MRNEFPNIYFYFVDGTVIEIGETGDVVMNRASWNHKHQVHANSFFIVVSPKGRIVYLSDVFDGSTHDKTSWEESGIVSDLEKFYGVPRNGDQFAIGGDKAYPNISLPNGWDKHITKSGEGEAAPNQPRLHFTANIAKYRATVERTIGKIKDWNVLLRQQYISFERNRLFRILFIISNLVNLTHFDLTPV
jgi:hypothetical protein